MPIFENILKMFPKHYHFILLFVTCPTCRAWQCGSVATSAEKRNYDSTET